MLSNERPIFKTVVRDQGNNAALKRGLLVPTSFDFDFIEVSPLIDAFRRMVRASEFDICELALSTYIAARRRGADFTALPLFVMRAFHHKAILRRAGSSIGSPKDLEGLRVGISRGYTVTTGVWARLILQHQYGVDLKRITWVISGGEHVPNFAYPKNVVALEAGHTLADDLAADRLAAVIGLDSHRRDLVPLIQDPDEAGLRALREHGHYPINHTIVVRDALLRDHPNLAVELFGLFQRSKVAYLRDLEQRAAELHSPVDKLYVSVRNQIGGDPLPYGIEPNRAMLDQFVHGLAEQGVISSVPRLESLFAAGTHHLVG